MVKRICFLLSVLLVLLGSGCQNNPPPIQTNNPTPPIQASQPPPTDPVTPPPSRTPIKDALEQRFAAAGAKGGHSAIPAGTRLLSINVKDGVAILDVSKEFNALADQGESVESKAQKELRATLAQFPEVHKMRLTVEGKPFDSQATDWNTPFPVRDGEAMESRNAANPNGGRNSR